MSAEFGLRPLDSDEARDQCAGAFGVGGSGDDGERGDIARKQCQEEHLA